KKKDEEGDDEEEEEAKDGDEKSEDENGEEEEYERLFATLSDWWGVTLSDDPIDPPSRASLQPGTGTEGLPLSISCHTSVFFDELGDQWQTVYARDGKPIIIERKIGTGTLVLSAATFFVSNEAVRDERHPELLAWILGPHHTIVFDEFRHGMTETVGLAELARRYRLHGAGAGLLLLALFFVWHSASALVPATGEGVEEPTDTVGRTSVSGLVNLLRRNVPANRVLSAALGEWKKSQTRITRDLETRVARMESIANADTAAATGVRDTRKAYNEMSRVANPPRGNTNRNTQNGERHT
ncbi:MAG: hypothetical protein HQ559_14845, partial [Lentisphaerae bacterium]|nr:hypothetical protein [Lentisphaerota bacterium]